MSNTARLLATLNAYRTVQKTFPELHPNFETRAAKWPRLDEAGLKKELSDLIAESERPGMSVRVFWKMGPDFMYEGCNRHIALDAGFKMAADLIGTNDFDQRVSWILQSAKYRKDDVEVTTSKKPKLYILERQNSAAEGTIFLHTGKAPIMLGDQAIGMLGMYTVIDGQAAAKIAREHPNALG
jgi:hypothetical protein